MLGLLKGYFLVVCWSWLIWPSDSLIFKKSMLWKHSVELWIKKDYYVSICVFSNISLVSVKRFYTKKLLLLVVAQVLWQSTADWVVSNSRCQFLTGEEMECWRSGCPHCRALVRVLFQASPCISHGAQRERALLGFLWWELWSHSWGRYSHDVRTSQKPHLLIVASHCP